MLKVLTWAFVIFFLWYMVTSPEGAAAWVQGVLGWMAHAGSSLSAFVDSLLTGLVLTVAVDADRGRWVARPTGVTLAAWRASS